MKMYNVKQIADMFNTNTETVRRWIRSGKLKAVQESRKGGNVVYEDMLDAFLKSSPKYAGSALTSLSSPVALAVYATLLGGGILVKNHLDNERLQKALVDSKEVEKLLKEEIASRKASIINKQKSVEQIRNEINEEQRYIDELDSIILSYHSHDKTEEGEIKV